MSKTNHTPTIPEDDNCLAFLVEKETSQCEQLMKALKKDDIDFYKEVQDSEGTYKFFVSRRRIRDARKIVDSLYSAAKPA